MARPIQRDRAKALKSARELFWRRGYSATSMNHLLAATGMGSGSFYAAFDSKKRLFEMVVDDYSGWSTQEFEAFRQRYRGLDVLRAFLEKTLINVSDDNRRKGCLLVNSALELEGVEPRLHQVVSRSLDVLESEIHHCLVEACEQGQLRDGIEIREMVGLLMSFIEGLRVGSRLGLTREEARRRVNTMLAMLTSQEGGTGYAGKF